MEQVSEITPMNDNINDEKMEQARSKMLKQREYVREYYHKRKEAGLIPTKRPILTEEEKLQRFMEKQDQLREKMREKYKADKEKLTKYKELFSAANGNIITIPVTQPPGN